MCQLPIKIIVILLVACALVLACEPSLQREDAFATEQKENSTFGVKITGFRERRTFGQILGGAYYVFEAKNKSERDWKKLMVYKYDDPIPIDKNSIVFVNETVGYVLMINRLAVTTNGGRDWSLWEVSKIEPLKDDLSCRIQKVGVLEDGTGTIDIKCNKSSIVLSTKDFGVSWKQ